MIRQFVMALALSLSATMTPCVAQTSAASLPQAPAPWTPTDGAVIDFEVLRQGKPFGRHVLTFEKDAEDHVKVTSDVNLEVKFGPITAFRYSLDSVEQWVDGKLVSLNGKTNNDGKKSAVSATAIGDSLKVKSTEFNGELPTTIVPSSHWNRKQVYQDRMLSTESGEVLSMNVEKIGRDTVSVGGKAIPATHYRIKSDMTVDLWYDDESRWVKLTFETRGQNIEYRLKQLY